MPSHPAAGSLARAFSSLHLSPPLERPSTPPSPEIPLSPSFASSFIMLTPPSPTSATLTMDSPLDELPAPPNSPAQPEHRGRKRQCSQSPPASPSLRFGRLRLTSPDSTSRSRSRSSQRDPSPTRHRSRSPPADRQQLRIPFDFEFSFSFSLDEEISASEYWDNLETEQFEREMDEIVEASRCPPDCNCNPDLWEDTVAASFDWDSFDESWQTWRSQQDPETLKAWEEQAEIDRVTERADSAN